MHQRLAVRLAPWILLMVAIVMSPQVASASVLLCVQITDSTNSTPGLDKLTRSEVRKHSSHVIVEDKCATRLLVELFNTGNTRYLSVGIEGQVPTRWVIENDRDIDRRLGEGIALSLGNDPEHLMASIDESSGLERMRHSLVEKGKNAFRIEAFEMMARTDKTLAFSPGLGFAVHRGAEHWQVFARTYLSVSPSSVAKSERVLRLGTGLDLGVNYEFSRRALTSPYVGAGLGLGFLRFEGVVNPSDPKSADHVETLGALTNARIGVRTLRFFDFDADIFLAGYLPLFKTRRVDADLFGENGTYTPFVQLGVGVGF
jgi:hypothetical protein